MGRGLVVGDMLLEGRICEGDASGGNKICCGGDVSRGLKEGARTGGVSVFPLKLVSTRGGKAASVGVIVGGQGLVMGQSRGLIGTEATGDGARERGGGEMLRE